MTYNCRYCKKEHDTCESRLKCQCGMSLDDSLQIAEKQLEEQADIRADRQRQGSYIFTDKRKVSDEFRS